MTVPRLSWLAAALRTRKAVHVRLVADNRTVGQYCGFPLLASLRQSTIIPQSSFADTI